ncbi:transcriptional regulator [Streptomyces finlayi]|uniref:transcriptional regulator n=1 Tax=Streptomyces finlayi TaxID=67296 RepID=UPI00215610AE|nr:transcriptional regulator [Streptomyces finlayi]
MKSVGDSQPVPKRATHRVRIDDLVPADSPRLNGIDGSHVRRLAAICASLTPELVHRPALRVVDGMHRIGAAVLQGLDTVDVQHFDSSENQVFLRSVTANAAHCLPLSVAERKVAPGRLLASHPSLSDRTVAACVGLDSKTVASVRVCSAAGSPPSNMRTGADGRTHPLDRIHAAELMTRGPALSLRAVVRETGLSLGTAHDVRRRPLRGEDPVPPSRQSASPRAPAHASEPPQGAAHSAPLPPLRMAEAFGTGPAPRGDGVPPLPRATGNPAQAGQRPLPAPFRHRARLRPPAAHPLHRRRSLAETGGLAPPHTTESVAELARHCSDAWRRFAEDVSRRKHLDTTRRTEMHATQPTRR